MDQIELSYCVVNTAKRELLVRALDSIARERERLPFACEVLVLDNCSRDGSAQAARSHRAVDDTIALTRRRGKALNDSELLRRARGRYALLMNEDTELRPGATRHTAPLQWRLDVILLLVLASLVAQFDTSIS